MTWDTAGFDERTAPSTPAGTGCRNHPAAASRDGTHLGRRPSPTRRARHPAGPGTRARRTPVTTTEQIPAPSANLAAAARTANLRGRQAINAALAGRYAEGATIRQLADETGFSYAAVRQSLVDQRVPLRPKGGRRPRDHHQRSATRLAPLRIGYSMWGFLTAGRPDADSARAYRREVIDAIQAAGHRVVLLQPDRDRLEAGADLRGTYEFDDRYPELDAILFEWRWPQPGRNTTVCGSAGHTCDLHRQNDLLGHYTHTRHTPTLIWDTHRRLPAADPIRCLPHVRVAEHALRPTPGAITIACPVPDTLLERADPAELASRNRPLPLVYVGNQHDRTAAFEKYFAPAAAQFGHLVAGTWTTTRLWPHITFIGPCRFDQVAPIHANALATVLLLPDRYATAAHQTSRLFEAALQGCLPLTPADTTHADQFTPTELHVHDGTDVITALRWLHRIHGGREHRRLIAACLLHLHRYRLSRQVSILLDTLAGLAQPRQPAPFGQLDMRCL